MNYINKNHTKLLSAILISLLIYSDGAFAVNATDYDQDNNEIIDLSEFERYLRGRVTISIA